MQAHAQIILQETTGRRIASKYVCLHATCHGGALIVLVCPDGTTAATQQPCALRVYALDMQSSAWSLVSPARTDGENAQYPLPRSRAACCRHGDKVRAP